MEIYTLVYNFAKVGLGYSNSIARSSLHGAEHEFGKFSEWQGDPLRSDFVSLPVSGRGGSDSVCRKSVAATANQRLG